MIIYNMTQLADVLGISVFRLKKYLKEGDIKPARQENTIKYFTPDTIQKVKDIMEGKSGA